MGGEGKASREAGDPTVPTGKHNDATWKADAEEMASPAVKKACLGGRRVEIWKKTARGTQIAITAVR